MKVTATVYLNKSKDSKRKASANIVLEDAFVIKGLGVLNGTKGDFVAMPQYKDSKGEFHDRCFPLSKALREEINKVVLEEYSKALAEENAEEQEENELSFK